MGKRRRGSGEGTITQREDGRWMGQLSLGFDDVTGKCIRKTEYGDTQAEVREKLDRLKREYADGGPVADPDITVRRFLDLWLAGLKHAVAEKTYDRYELDVSHLNDHLGTRLLAQLTGFHVTRMYQDMEEAGCTVAARHMVGKRLRQALAVADQMGYVRKNAAKQVPLPRPVRAEIHPLAPDEVRRLLEVTAGDRYHALYVVAIDSGAREGELLALNWEDWNPARRELTIIKSLTQTKECKLVAKEPKTKASRRKVVLGEESAAALQAHRDRQRAKGLKTGVVFAASGGGYTFRHNLITYSFRPALSRAGLPVGVRFHDLRHTCATLLLMSGVDPKTVAERLGHASTQRLFDTYAHVLPAMRQRGASVMDAFLGGSKVAVNGTYLVTETE